jgi:simple sugar transport system ATP-binding protein
VSEPRATVARAENALSLAGITKCFGGVVALDDVSLEVRRGTIHALLGENGAGKSTLMRVAFGMLQAERGEISVNGERRRFTSSAEAIAARIGMVHQHFTNVPAMTVAENVALGGRGRYDAEAAAERVREIGARTGLDLNPEARADSLSVGAQQRLEIVKALNREASLLILDEPTAVLAPAEADELLSWLRAFAGEGRSVVLITHKLREAFAIADDVTVLRRGRRIVSSPASELTLESATQALLGDQAPRASQRAPAMPSSIVAELQGVIVADDRGVVVVADASVTVKGGEILGVAGVEGAGQRELLRVLAGRLVPLKGQRHVTGDVGFIPEDRHHDALVLDFSRTENVALRGAGERRGVVRWGIERERATRLAGEFDVRGGSATTAVRELSGGNQQKLVLARELANAPALVVAENPTRGLDIRATSDVHDRLREAALAGAGVVVYSSDLDEVLSLATRIVVMHDGRLREVERSRDEVGRAMLGLS